MVEVNSLSSKLSLEHPGFSLRTAQENVTLFLRHAIVSGRLPPGTRLIQAELASTLNISVTPIREALRELGAIGLVDLDPFRGAVVHTPTLIELEEIFEIRAVLLPLNIRQGVHRIEDSMLNKAEEILDKMEGESDPAIWIDLNRQFHELLYKAHSNARLYQILQQLADLADLYINLSFSKKPLQRQSSEREHRQILSAYRRRNAEQAAAIAVAHINSTLEAAREALTQEYSSHP
jgi:DNA-binding GntR family transcriptional regulator